MCDYDLSENYILLHYPHISQYILQRIAKRDVALLRSSGSNLAGRRAG